MAIKQININNQKFDISYDVVNPKNSDTIVFLHGWGSNKNIMKQAFANQLTNMKHFYIDMPGFGNSSNDYILTTKEYAAIVQEFLDQFDNIDIKMIAGHSFGGKVAALLKPKLLILLSSAGIIEPKPFMVQIKIKLAKVLNLFGLSKLNKIFRSGDVDQMSENMYQTFKNVVDEDFSQVFANYDGKTKIFWGKSDTATSLKSGQSIHQLIKNSEFKVYDGDHYFFLHHAKDVSKCIC